MLRTGCLGLCPARPKAPREQELHGLAGSLLHNPPGLVRRRQSISLVQTWLVSAEARCLSRQVGAPPFTQLFKPSIFSVVHPFRPCHPDSGTSVAEDSAENFVKVKGNDSCCPLIRKAQTFYHRRQSGQSGMTELW